MFANFAPTKDKDWLLEPGKIYVLKYRLVVFMENSIKKKQKVHGNILLHLLRSL